MWVSVFAILSWETLIGLPRSSGDSASAASSTLREAQVEYRMCVRASWAVMYVYFYIACRSCAGNPLQGGNNHRLHLPADIPAKLFWNPFGGKHLDRPAVCELWRIAPGSDSLARGECARES